MTEALEQYIYNTAKDEDKPAKEKKDNGLKALMATNPTLPELYQQVPSHALALLSLCHPDHPLWRNASYPPMDPTPLHFYPGARGFPTTPN